MTQDPKDEMTKRSSIFISCTYQDKARITPLASYLGRLGLQVWMHTKDHEARSIPADAIIAAMQKADLYTVALSPEALTSRWVQSELRTALKTSGGPQKVRAILLASAPLPHDLAELPHINLIGSLHGAKPTLMESVETYLGAKQTGDVGSRTEEPPLVISSVRLRLEDETNKCYGEIVAHAATRDEVQQEAAALVRKLRRRANGILLNFIPASELYFSSEYFFPNGNLTERVVEIEGDFLGTLKMRAIVEVEVLNPEERRLADLVSTKLESLDVGKVVYTFFLSPPRPDLPQRSLERLQQSHVILGWDPKDGAEVELPDDLKLFVRCTEEEIQIGLETRYRFQLQRKVNEFSVRDFVDSILA